jgi:hypothetical protein
MADLTIKQGDTWPPLVSTLEENGAAIDLTTAVSVTMRIKSTGLTLSNLACSIDTPASGVVSYTWADGDTDVPGTYTVDFVIDWDDDKLQTAPNDSEKSLVIRAANL